MIQIPQQLRSIVPIQEILKVEDWWEKLSEENQLELEAFYNEDPDSTEQFISIQLCGKFVEQEVQDHQDVFWINYFYDYLVNHELIIDESKPRIGGVCSANKAAENAIRNGFIARDFSCPESNEHCQMRKILDIDQGKSSLQFYLRFKLESNKPSPVV